MIIREEFDPIDVYDMSDSDLKSGIREMLPKVKFIETDLDERLLSMSYKGKEKYNMIEQEIFNVIHDSNNGYIVDKLYPLIINQAKTFCWYNSKRTINLFNLNNGVIWSVSRGGTVKVDSPFSRKEGLQRLYIKLAQYLDEK